MPQPGFDRWVSFRGQGSYLPTADGLNVDGKAVPQRGYITDELTDYALDWLKGRGAERPFFLYLSHKAVHSEFVPAERHQGRYAGKPFTPPATMADTPSNYEGKPMWVRNQRNSWHGVDFPYHSALDIAAVLPPLRRDAAGRRRQPRPDRGAADGTQAARRHAGRLHGRQRVRLRRARPDRQAHGLRDVDAGAAADGRRRLPCGNDRQGGRRQHRHRADHPRGRRRCRRRRWTDEASSRWPEASAHRGATRSCTSTTGSATSRRRRRCTPARRAVQVHPLLRAVGHR